MTDGFLSVKEGFRPQKFYGRDLDPSTPLDDSSLVAGVWNGGAPQYVAIGIESNRPSVQAGGSGTNGDLYLNPLRGVVKTFGHSQHLVATSSNYNMDDTPVFDNSVLIDCSGGDKTVQLPDTATASGGFAGRIVRVKKSSNDTNNLTIATLGAGLIDGAASITLSTAYAYGEFQTDGSNWFIISEG